MIPKILLLSVLLATVNASDETPTNFAAMKPVDFASSICGVSNSKINEEMVIACYKQAYTDASNSHIQRYVKLLNSDANRVANLAEINAQMGMWPRITEAIINIYEKFFKFFEKKADEANESNFRRYKEREWMFHEGNKKTYKSTTKRPVKSTDKKTEEDEINEDGYTSEEFIDEKDSK